VSKLAKKIAPEGSTAPRRPRKPGPLGQCFQLYDVGDMEDWAAVDALRYEKDSKTKEPLGWRGAQARIDGILGITPGERLDLERFRYHWRRRCACWPKDLRL
jgi:hypothetical protein